MRYTPAGLAIRTLAGFAVVGVLLWFVTYLERAAAYLLVFVIVSQSRRSSGSC